MATNCVLFVLLTVSYQCYGGLLDGILTGAHETHNKVHDVANTFLGGLSQGLNLNFQGHFGVNNQQRPPQQNYGGGQSGKPGETVVIVVEKEPHRDQHRPGYNNRPHNNGYGNNRPGYGNKPNYNNPNYNNQGQGNPYQNPNYNNHHNHGYGNGNGNGNWNGNNGNNENYQPNNGIPNQNNYGQPSRPTYGNPQQGGQNQYTTELATKEPEKNTPNYGSIYNPSNDNNGSQKPSDGGLDQDKFNEKPTKKPEEDKPLFVPLNPNEYIYGGDKVDVTAPKRETNDNKPKPAESGDDDFPIDIRFQDN